VVVAADAEPAAHRVIGDLEVEFITLEKLASRVAAP
jgi:hypothetical protein